MNRGVWEGGRRGGGRGGQMQAGVVIASIKQVWSTHRSAQRRYRGVACFVFLQANLTKERKVALPPTILTAFSTPSLLPPSLPSHPFPLIAPAQFPPPPIAVRRAREGWGAGGGGRQWRSRERREEGDSEAGEEQCSRARGEARRGRVKE